MTISATLDDQNNALSKYRANKAMSVPMRTSHYMNQSPRDFPFSFDEQGVLSVKEGRVFRRVHGGLREAVERLKTRDNLGRLTEAGMVPTAVHLDAEGYNLEHKFVPFITHPQEWTFKMLQKAALCSLDVAIELNRLDLSLQDPHAWNVTFCHGKPVYLDFSSITLGRELHPRFMDDVFKSFYVPLWLSSFRLGREKTYQIAKAVMNAEHEWRIWQQPRVEWRRLFDDNLLGRLCWSYRKILRRYGEEKDPINLLRAMKDHVQSLQTYVPSSQWSEYGQPGGSFEDEASFSPKAVAATTLLKRLPPGRLLDLACNQGWFTGYAAKLGHTAIGLDVDSIAVDAGLANAQRYGFDIAHMNVLWPTPQQGAFLMYPSAYERFACDTVLMIALQHHLNLRQAVRFDVLAAMAARYGAKNLLIEWIPRDDVIVKDWLATGKLGSVPDWYNEENFENAMKRYFPVFERLDSGSGHDQFPGPTPRKMYLFRQV